MNKRWLKEAMFAGMTTGAFKLGTALTFGWFWVRSAGCSLLYRGSSMDQIDFDNILTLAQIDAAQIQPPSYVPHENSTIYFYVVQRINGYGDEERTLSAAVKVSIDGNGNLAEPVPNSIFEAGIGQVADSKVRLIWYYCPIGQRSAPARFNVYYDSGTGQIDYETSIAVISYAGRRFYSYQTDTLEAGRYSFAIRAEDSAGIENTSLAQLSIQIDGNSPAAVEILSAEAV